MKLRKLLEIELCCFENLCYRNRVNSTLQNRKKLISAVTQIHLSDWVAQNHLGVEIDWDVKRASVMLQDMPTQVCRGIRRGASYLFDKAPTSFGGLMISEQELRTKAKILDKLLKKMDN